MVLPSVPVPTDCAPVCNRYHLAWYRWGRLCHGLDAFEPEWNTQACADATELRDKVGALAKEWNDKPDAGPLCQCGRELPMEPRDKQQVQSPHCEGICARAEASRRELDHECQSPPSLPAYDAPQCYEMEERFFGMRPEVFQCWCRRVSSKQRAWFESDP